MATIGIRGTGMYLQAEPEPTYVCTCYGVADLAANRDAPSQERVVTRHHDAPRYILVDGLQGQLIRPAAVINHSDNELALIQVLVGRSVPLPFSGGYRSPRKSMY